MNEKRKGYFKPCRPCTSYNGEERNNRKLPKVFKKILRTIKQLYCLSVALIYQGQSTVHLGGELFRRPLLPQRFKFSFKENLEFSPAKCQYEITLENLLFVFRGEKTPIKMRNKVS